MRTTKVRYDGAVTAAHFEFVDAEIAAAARVIEQGFENPDDALVSAVALVPWMDPGDAPARASAAAAKPPPPPPTNRGRRRVHVRQEEEEEEEDAISGVESGDTERG